jgi:hypothetical protein
MVDYSHFLSIPLIEPILQAKVKELQGEWMAKFGEAKKLHPSIFVPPRRLHLTLFMLKLYSKQDQQKVLLVSRLCVCEMLNHFFSFFFFRLSRQWKF